MILILGGTAAYHLNHEQDLGPTQRVELDTPYGLAFPIFLLPETNPPIAFASRHGLERLERTPPFVNARANLWAAHALGVRAILGWNGVGAINPLLELHDVLVPDGLIDYTRNRPRSFQPTPDPPPLPCAPLSEVPSPGEPDAHLFSTPARTALFGAARATTARAFPVGVYACSHGPRLETAAEIRGFARMGADVVGMTLVPEIFLAHELGIAYASLAYVTNYATGIEPVNDAPRHFGDAVARHCLHITQQAAATWAA